MEERDDYKFLKLRDAVTCLNQRVNLIGVVVEFGFPKLTKGTDYFVSVKLVDESYSNQGVSVNFFAENVEKLPFVASPGDIVQLSHAVMKMHDGEVYVYFNKKFSSFALYEGIDGKDFAPYQVSARFHSRELDKKFIADLRTWLLNFQVNLDPNDFQMINELKEGQRNNLVGKILHVTKVAKDDLTIFLWDGTDAPINNIQTKLIDEMNTPLPLHLEPVSLSRDVLSSFPTAGTILRVFVDQGNKNLGLGVLKAGQWINFFNIICEVHAGLWRGILMPFTKFRYIAKNSRYALTCLSKYEERLSLKAGRVHWSCSSPSALTEVGHADVPFSSLMDVITYSEVTAKFKCVVRVVAVLPFRVEDFVSPLGIYRVRLTLEDPTARIFAFLYDEDAPGRPLARLWSSLLMSHDVFSENFTLFIAESDILNMEIFFEGYPSGDVLKRKMKKLLGIGENDQSNETEYTVRDPPWVVCCLKSYYTDKLHAWESRQYRICETRLVG